MVAGIAVGWLLRKHSFKIVGVVLIVLVWALLFFLGIEVGENEKIIGSLQNLGLEALLLSVAPTIIFAKWFFDKMPKEDADK